MYSSYKKQSAKYFLSRNWIASRITAQTKNFQWADIFTADVDVDCTEVIQKFYKTQARLMHTDHETRGQDIYR